MRYLYDESNNPVGFGMQYPTETKWENYYFAKNVQGDIVAIYRYDYDASTQKPYGTLIATYQYDPWGNPRGDQGCQREDNCANGEPCCHV